MSPTRVYVPTTRSGLARLAASGSLGSPPVFGCAVTPDLRAWFPGAHEEELDAEAMAAAALESLRLVAADDQETRRRAVLAVDVPATAVSPDPAAGRAAVRVAVVVELREVVAIYVDGDEAVEGVTAAAAALDDADRGRDDAAAVVGRLEDAELLWYGTQEIGDLVG